MKTLMTRSAGLGIFRSADLACPTARRGKRQSNKQQAKRRGEWEDRDRDLGIEFNLTEISGPANCAAYAEQTFRCLQAARRKLSDFSSNSGCFSPPPTGTLSLA